MNELGPDARPLLEDGAAAHWPELSGLLDAALDLEPAARGPWLESLPATPAKVALERLLAQQARVESRDFLGALPRMSAAAGAALARHEDAGRRGAQAGDLVGPWRLLRTLGQGGMGAVWLAERADGALNRQVALKLPHATWRPGLAERLQRERDILASLEHPHIARLYDAGVDAHGRPWLALEYVAGRPIDEFVQQQAADLRTRVGLVLQVAQAVAFAHGRLVIHRDLKPSNILVSDEGQVHLLDFGIAKLLHGETAEETALTREAGRALTPEYASPEQIRGEALGTASDVYSLGVVAYELLAGVRPHRARAGSGGSAVGAAALDPLIEAEAPLASQAAEGAALAKALRGDLDAILNKALKRNPAERYSTVDAMALDLARHLAGEAVAARPDSLGYRLHRFARRQRRALLATAAVVAAFGLGLGAGTTALVIFVLLIGLSAALWQARRARREAGEARRQARRAEEVKDFVLAIFNDAEPGAGGSRKTTALDLLAQARQRLADTPPAEISTRIELLTAIGTSTAYLGDAAAAEPTLQEAARLAGARLALGDPQRFDAELVLGRMLLLAGDQQRAAPLIESAVAGARLVDDAVMLARGLRWVANLRVSQGRADEAIAAAQEAVRRTDSLPPGRVRTRLVYESNIVLANTIDMFAREGSLPYAERGLQAALEVHGERVSSEVLSARGQVAHSLLAQSRLDEAHELLSGIVEQQMELLGPDHWEVGQTLERLGAVAVNRGDAAAGITAFTKALHIAQIYSAGQPARSVVTRLGGVGVAHLAARELEQALAALDRTLEIRQAMQGDRVQAGLSSRYYRVEVLVRLGRIDEAAHELDAIELQEQLPPDLAVPFRRCRALLRSAQRRHAEAEADFAAVASAYTGDRRHAVPHARTLCQWGIARVRAGRHAEAVEVLEEGHHRLAALQSCLTPERAETQIALAEARSALGRHDAALEAAHAAVAFWDRYSAGHPLAEHAREVLSAVQAAAG